MYASVRPYRHTYGNYGIRLQTWTQVIVNRCIGKIIARDLSLVASRQYRMAVTWTWVTCRRYNSLEGSNFRPENWNPPSRCSKRSSHRTVFNAGRNSHLLVWRFNNTWLAAILNFRSRNAILLGKVSTFWQKNWDLHRRTWELSTWKP